MRIDLGNAASARAYGIDVDLRDLQRHAVDHIVHADPRPQIADHRDIGTGAAHIIGDNVLGPDRRHEMSSRGDTRGRAGENC